LLGIKPEPTVIPGLTPAVESSRGIDLEYEPEGTQCLNVGSYIIISNSCRTGCIRGSNTFVKKLYICRRMAKGFRGGTW